MKIRFSGLLLLAALLLPTAAWAGMTEAPAYTPLNNAPAWEFTSVGNTLNNGLGYTLGEVFTPTEDIYVNYLGYYYDSATGMVESHTVGLYDAEGDLLDSTVITGSSSYCSPSDEAPVACPTASGTPHFLYNPTQTVELVAGQTYVLEGTSGVIDPYAFNDPGFSTLWPLEIEGSNAVENGGFTLSFNGSSPDEDIGDGPWGADMGYETPEPSSFLLLGSGLAGLAGLLKRKLAA